MGTSKQLSSGTEDDQMEPQPLGGKQLDTRKVIMVSAGGQHTVVLAADSADKWTARIICVHSSIHIVYSITIKSREILLTCYRGNTFIL